MGSRTYSNASNLGWVVQKFGGTSVGKFPEKVSIMSVYGNKLTVSRLPMISSSMCMPLYLFILLTPSRASLSRNRVVVVCSARSTGKKVSGTTSR